MKRDYSQSPLKVRGDKTFEVSNAQAVGFSLERVSGRGFPVLVYIDDAATPVRIDNGNTYEQETSFAKLVVDTTPGGGEEGDEWRVKLTPTAYDIERSRLRRDSRDVLLTAPASAVVLFDLDSRKDPAPFTAVIGYEGPFVVDTRYPDALSLAQGEDVGPPNSSMSGDAWDVSAFPRVMFCLEQWSVDQTSPHAGTLSISLAGAVSPTGRNAFTLSSDDVGAIWDGTTTAAYLSTGAHAPTTTAFIVDDTRRVPAVRFYLNSDGDLDASAFNNKNQYWLRLYAVGMY